jgi:hypothetical protein
MKFSSLEASELPRKTDCFFFDNPRRGGLVDFSTRSTRVEANKFAPWFFSV